MHEITLMQGIGLAVMALIVGIDFWLEALYIFRPLIVCTLTGAILGDVQTGLFTGELIASYVHLTVAAKVEVTARHAVSWQEAFFDKVFPNLLLERDTLTDPAAFVEQALAADLHVNAALQRTILPSPGNFRNLVPVQHLVRMAQKQR